MPEYNGQLKQLYDLVTELSRTNSAEHQDIHKTVQNHSEQLIRHGIRQEGQAEMMLEARKDIKALKAKDVDQMLASELVKQKASWMGYGINAAVAAFVAAIITGTVKVFF